MLFNSIGFIFLFLPLGLAGYYLLAASPWPVLRRPFLVILTLVFYGFAGPKFLPLLLGSTVLNYFAGQAIGRAVNSERWRFILLALAVGSNLLLLGYFKYFNFLLTTINTAFSAGFELERILLPLGISFFTFQQIGYLVDVARRKVQVGSALDYANFVLFFPQLLAGPIVLYNETVSQFARPVLRSQIGRDILIGTTIFCIGLFKKTVLSDSLAYYASPTFTAAAAGDPIGTLDVWVAAFAYTAQVYFDFSGYSDMAIGTARMFGIVLPLNFLSPLRSSSVTEIWRRWHVTLGRWVQIYVFQPISMPLARAAARGGAGNYGTLFAAMIVPTIVSMLIIGVWHGAGWTFVVFGLMHGLYMSVGEFWATWRRKARKARKKAGLSEPIWHRPVAQAATLLAFVAAIIPFGAADGETMMSMFAAALGGGSMSNVSADWPFGLGAALATIFSAYLIIYLLPNSHEIMGRFEPVLEWSKDWSKRAPSPVQVVWEINAFWAMTTGLVMFLAVAFIMRGTTQFIYFNF